MGRTVVRMMLAMVVAAAAPAAAAAQTTLDAVKARGTLECGVNGTLRGFSLADGHGNWSGLDVDYCRAVAAAIFGDPGKVDYVALSTAERFSALQSGKVDVLMRNTTWTSSRDTALGIVFTGVTFYDHEAFLVRKAQHAKSALDLSNVSVCLQRDTTSELNLKDYFNAHKIKLKMLVFATAAEAIKAYDAKRCEAYATFASAIRSEMRSLDIPDEHDILDDVIAKEPLGPAVRAGDEQWFRIIRWVHFVMLDAEELGVTQGNADASLKSDVPEIRRLLGVEGDFGRALGLPNDWAYRIVKLVGNYGEVFERNVGQHSALKMPRGYNALWNHGGLQYAPPIR